MKTKILITSLSLLASSAYAQPSIPSVGVPPPTVRAEMPGQSVPSMPQPAMQRPVPQMNQGSPQPAVGATGGTGGNGGNGGLIIGTGGTGGAGAIPMPANNAKGPTSVGSTQSEAQAMAKAEAEARAEVRAKAAQLKEDKKSSAYPDMNYRELSLEYYDKVTNPPTQ